MYKRLTELLSTATFRQTSLTSFSSVINGALGAAFYFLLARELGNAGYGQFSLITSAITTLAGVADLGSDQSLIRFATKDLAYTKAAFIIKLTSGLIFSLVSFAISPSWFSVLIGLGLITQLFFSFSISVSQSFQRYFRWSILLIGTNLLRLLLILLIWNNLSVLSAGTVYILCPLVGFIVFWFISKTDFITAHVSRKHFQEIFSFNKWVTAFVIVNTIGSKLDIFMTAKFTNLAATGVYSLATQLVSILPQITTAVGAVSSPKFASFTTTRQNHTYVAKSFLFSSAIAALSSIFLLLLAFGIILFTGSDYSSAWPSFLILLLSMDIFLITTPLRDSILYFFIKPQFFFYSSLIQVTLTLLLGQLLIPIYGLAGSATAVLCTQAFLAVASVIYYFRLRMSHV